MTDDIRTPAIGFTVHLVAGLHRNQRYGDAPNPDGTIGDPYLTHVLDVSRRLRVYGLHAVLAGLLHDTVEDTVMTLEVLEGVGYPQQVIEAVDAVTLRPGETYEQLIGRAAAHPLGCVVKLADNYSNFENLASLQDRRRAIRLIKKYITARPPLIEVYNRMMLAAAAAGDSWPRFGPAVPDDQQW